jgi:hypothetical protein
MKQRVQRDIGNKTVETNNKQHHKFATHIMPEQQNRTYKTEKANNDNYRLLIRQISSAVSEAKKAGSSNNQQCACRNLLEYRRYIVH